MRRRGIIEPAPMLTVWLERVGFALGCLLIIAGSVRTSPTNTEKDLALCGGGLICWSYALANARRTVLRASAVGSHLSEWDWASASKLTIGVVAGSAFIVAAWTGANPLAPFALWLRAWVGPWVRAHWR